MSNKSPEYEGREAFEWWWGLGGCGKFDRTPEHNPDDEDLSDTYE